MLINVKIYTYYANSVPAIVNVKNGNNIFISTVVVQILIIKKDLLIISFLYVGSTNVIK